MFVSILRKGQTHYYDCERTFLTQDDANPDQILVRMEGPAVNVVVGKKTAQVFLFNNQGQQIDSFRWTAKGQHLGVTAVAA